MEVVIVGIFLVFALFITPIQNLFPETITEQVTIISKSDGECVVNSQDHPIAISNCNYDIGDKYRLHTSMKLFLSNSIIK